MPTPPGILRRFAGVFLAAVVAAPIVILAGASTPAQAAGTPLYPDLHTLAPRDLRFDRADISADLTGNFHNVMRFSNDTYNSGEGPLILNAHIDPTTLKGPSTQRVMNSDGTFTDIPLNNDMYWHAAHHHYHFDNWNGYQLWTKTAYDNWVASGRTVGSPLYTGSKTTSCVTTEEFIVSAPAAVYPGGYPLGGCQTDGQGNLHMGLSVGWGDTYDWYRQLQWIDFGQNTLGNGTYVLYSVSDPLNIVYESPGKADQVREGVDSNAASTTFVVSNGTILDSDAPTGTVSINHVDASTNNAAVSIDVVARDDVSQPNQFRLSNDGVTFKTFSYTSNGSNPTTVAWNLTDPLYGGNTTTGLKTVYTQVHDNSGKWGATFSDTIQYGSGGPPPPPPPPPNSPYAKDVIGDNPSGYWRLDESAGLSAADTFGSNPGVYQNGVTLGRPSLLTGDTDPAAGFSGTSQYVAIPSSGPLAPASSVTAEAWIKPTTVPSSSFASVVTKKESYSLQFNSGKMEFTIMQSGTRRRLQAPAGAIVAGGTYYVVGTYDGTTQRLYINGTQVASAALTGGITTNVNNVDIGSWDGTSEFFAGTIDEVAVYPTVLSATQVATHYADGISTGGTQAQLSISRSGSGGGNVTSVPAGIDCGATCSHQFTAGTSVTLTAAPNSGSTFAGWSGGGCSGTGTCALTVNSNTIVNAAFTLSSGGGGTYAQAVTGDGPVGYWRLDETSGTTATDTTGTSNGTYASTTLGAPGLLASASDKSATFNGTSSKVTIASKPALSPASTVSVEAWIKPTSLPTAGSFASIATKTESYSLQFNGPKMEFTIMQGGVRKRMQAPTGAIVAGGTYHVVGTYDGTTQRLYINGAQAASGALTGGITVNTTSVYIGSWNGSSEFFKGTIDEVAVYPTVLSAGQVSTHYNTGITSLVALVQKPVSAQLVASSKLAANRSAAIHGSTPVAVAIDSGLHRAYVTGNAGKGHKAGTGLTIFDSRTWRRLGYIATSPTAGPSSVAVDPVTPRVYVTSAVYTPFDVHGAVLVIDPEAKLVIQTIRTGPGPKAVAVSPATRRLYVTERTGIAGSLAIAVFNLRTAELLRTIPIGPYGDYYDNPFGLAVNTETNRVYASNPLDGYVYTLDGATNTIMREAAVGGEPGGIAVNTATNKVFVTGARSVVVINGRSGSVERRVAAGARTRGIAVDSAINKVYATTNDGGFLVIDGHTLNAGQMLTHGRKPNGIAIDPSSGTIVIANGYNANVSVYSDDPAGTS